MDFAVEMVKCVSDGADVTDVNIEDLVLSGMLAQLGANRYLQTARFAYREPPPGARGPIRIRAHYPRPLACC